MADDLANKFLGLRHSKVHLCLGAQHPGRLPVQVLGNFDCVISFALQDERDRRPMTQVMNLSKAQAERLSIQEKGHAICFLPRSEFKRAFSLEIDWCEVDRDASKIETAAFVRDLPWTPLDDEVEHNTEAPQQAHGLDRDAESLLRPIFYSVRPVSKARLLWDKDLWKKSAARWINVVPRFDGG